MNWFKRMVIRWVREDWEQSGKIKNYAGESIAISDSSSEGMMGDPVLHFKVYPAVGGRIVEFRRIDRKHGNHETTAYVITEDQNFGERIAKISTIENLKA